MNLAEAVAQSFVLWSRVLKSAPVLDAELRDIWASVLAVEDVTPDELKAAATQVLASSTFFPTPGEVMELVREIRKSAREDARRARLDRLRASIGPDGELVALRLQRGGESPALEARAVVPITEEQRQEVLASLSPRAAALLRAITAEENPNLRKNRTGGLTRGGDSPHEGGYGNGNG